MLKKKYKDIDYLYASARVKMMERQLLNSARMDRMVTARSPLEAAQVLTECGYPELMELTPEILDQTLDLERQKVFSTLYAIVPNHAIIDVFKLKYDYHNVKVLLKSTAVGEDANHLLMDIGRVPAKKLANGILQSKLEDTPPILQAAVQNARKTLRTTGDPQLSDLVLDRAYFEDMTDLAKQTGSRFLEGYVRLSIDAANLRSAVRALRMQKSPEFLRRILFPGGDISRNRIIMALSSGSALDTLYSVSPLKDAAQESISARKTGSLTRFEKLCDNAVSRYLQSAKYNSISEAPVICYIGAKESELTAVRIILTGLMAGITPEVLQERLRDVYA